MTPTHALALAVIIGVPVALVLCCIESWWIDKHRR